MGFTRPPHPLFGVALGRRPGRICQPVKVHEATLETLTSIYAIGELYINVT